MCEVRTLPGPGVGTGGARKPVRRSSLCVSLSILSRLLLDQILISASVCPSAPGPLTLSLTMHLASSDGHFVLRPQLTSLGGEGDTNDQLGLVSTSGHTLGSCG